MRQDASSAAPKTRRGAGRPARGPAGNGKGTEESSELAVKSGEGGALARGLAVLDALSAAERPLYLGELSALTRLTPSTLHRLVQSLVQARRIVRMPNGQLSLSPKSLVPLSLHHPLHTMRRDASEVLSVLQKTYGPTAAIIVFVGFERFALEIKPGDDSFVGLLDIHLESFLHASSSGKILLSALPREEADGVLGEGPYPAFTANTITDPGRFRRELEDVATSGYAINMNEACEGLSAVGAPIVVPGQPGTYLGSIHLTGSSKFFTPASVEKMVTDLKAAARLFSVASPTTRNVARFLGLC
ncbi:MAG: IclR family transcriptional regulator [Lautropia sp.]